MATPTDTAAIVQPQNALTAFLNNLTANAQQVKTLQNTINPPTPAQTGATPVIQFAKNNQTMLWIAGAVAAVILLIVLVRK